MTHPKTREHGSAKASLWPRADLHEEGEFPGAPKDKIDVSLVDGRLFIAAPAWPRLSVKEKEKEGRASG